MADSHLFAAIVIAGLLLSVSASADHVTPTDRVTRGVSVRAAPKGDGKFIQLLRPGESLRFVRNERETRYRRVLLGDGREAFVSRAFTKRISDALVDSKSDRAVDELRVHFLNVGAGTCTLVECPGAGNPSPLLVDCGSLGGKRGDLSGEAAKTYVDKVLKNHKANLNVVLSHADRDHYGLVPTVLAEVQADHIWQGGDPENYTTSGFPAWLKSQIEGGAKVQNDFEQGFHNDELAIDNGPTCGDASVFILTVNSGGSKNANSLVLAIDYEDFSVTLTGDAEGSTEDLAMENFGDSLKTTVLTGSHHGASSHSSNSVDWIEATDPEVVVYSAGRKFGHPRCDVTERFHDVLAKAAAHKVRCGKNNTTYRRSKTVTLAEYMTAVSGAVIVTSDGKSPLRLTCTRSENCSSSIEHD